MDFLESRTSRRALTETSAPGRPKRPSLFHQFVFVINPMLQLQYRFDNAFGRPERISQRAYAPATLYSLNVCATFPPGFMGWAKRGCLLLLLFAVGGCLQTRISEPPRTAVEQLLISTAADRSLHAVEWRLFDGKRVFVETNYFQSYDHPYVLGSIRNLLSIHGALLATNVNDANIVIEPRSGALSTDSSSSLLGMPSIPVPIPFAGTFTSPEVALLKSDRLFSTAKIALFAYNQGSRKHFYSSGPLVGRASHKYYKFLGYLSITRTDLPEKKRR